MTSAEPARRPNRRPPTSLAAERARLRAMKRALANAPLGPLATLALSHAVMALEENLRASTCVRSHTTTSGLRGARL